MLRHGETGGARTPLAGLDGPALTSALAALPYDWVRLLEHGQAPTETGEPADLAAAVDVAGGHVAFRSADGSLTKLWRRDALVALSETGLGGPGLSNLSAFEGAYGPAAHARAPRIAALLSRHGSVKFGGGEQFLDSMAEHYAAAGYEPVIVGVRENIESSEGSADGRRFAFVNAKPAMLRRFLLESRVQLVHAISGLGGPVVEALSYTNIPFIYGIHFWREALGVEGGEAIYFDTDGRPLARPEFRRVLSQAASVYVNSRFTQRVIEDAFGVRCPVVYSLPREVAEPVDGV